MEVEDSHETNVLRRLVASKMGIEIAGELLGGPGEETSREGIQRRVRLVRSGQRPPLFPHQGELVTKMVDVCDRRLKALLALPTGAGKTRTAVYSLLESFHTGDVQRVMWMAPSIELLDQARSTIEHLWREFADAPDIEILTKLRDVPGSDHSIVLTTPQSVYSSLRSRRPLPSGIDVLVFDEAHQLGAPTFREAMLGVTENPSNRVAAIGLSATPGRVDEDETDSLVRLFDGNMLTSSHLLPKPVESLQRKGILSKIAFRHIGGEWGSAGNEFERVVSGISLVRDLDARGKRVLVFSESVGGAIVLAEALSALGVRSEYVHGGLPVAKRSEAIERFATGRTHVLTNQRLLATGYDCPAISDLVLLGRISSPILFEQVVGRAARGPRTGGSRHATVWEFDDHLAMHGLPKSYYRYRDFDWRT